MRAGPTATGPSPGGSPKKPGLVRTFTPPTSTPAVATQSPAGDRGGLERVRLFKHFDSHRSAEIVREHGLRTFRFVAPAVAMRMDIFTPYMPVCRAV